VKLSFVPHTLQFKRPFSIAHGVRNSTPVVFTKLEHDGFTGYGEASLPPYLGETHETVLRFLKKAKKLLEGFPDPLDIENTLAVIDEIEKGNNAAKASIDISLHDLAGKIQNKSCHELFGTERNKNLFTAYTIPIDEPAGLQKRIDEAKEYKLLKVKLGSSNDKKVIEEIRKHTNKEFFVDANEGWADKHFALDMLCWLAEKKCLFAEQPMPKEMLDENAWLTEKSPIPIIADEAVKRLSDIEKAKGIYSGINVKLMKCTGLNEARKMISAARRNNMKILLGCMSETSCAVSAAAQIAPFADWIDLDGPLLIKEDYFNGIKFSDGKIILNDWAGIGVSPLKTLAEF
jgi:L-alanine-DL-glutamate epimerase-like enolase superfamily enzyme